MLTVAKEKRETSQFAVRLRSLRESAGITQVKAAEAAGVHIQTYMRWERGGPGEPTYSQLLQLAILFGVRLNDFGPENQEGDPDQCEQPS